MPLDNAKSVDLQVFPFAFVFIGKGANHKVVVVNSTATEKLVNQTGTWILPHDETSERGTVNNVTTL